MDDEAKQAIAGRWVGYREVFLNQDYEGWASFWTPDIRFIEPGMDHAGSDWFEFAREFWANGGRILTFEVEVYETFVHGDVAYQIGRFEESFEMAAPEPIVRKRSFFARWEKEAD